MRRLLLLALVCLLALATACKSKPIAPVPPPTLSGNVWIINRPGVQTRVTPYPQIKLQDGDVIRVLEVGGCVQTGGSGKTWKRYLDPRGKDSARLYHGLIWIPGATANGKVVPVGTNLVRVSSAVGNSYLVRQGNLPPSEMYLRLGYEDDHYSDNNYNEKKWDPGNPVQCEKAQDGTAPLAYVKLSITRSSSVESRSFLPFDLTADATDSNGLMLNPHWAGQDAYVSNGALLRPVAEAVPGAQFLPNADNACGGFPGDSSGFSLCKCPNPQEACDCKTEGKAECSSQAPSFDFPIRFSLNDFGIGPRAKDCPNESGGGLYGHANWVPVTMRGKLTWSNDQPFDEDADIFFTRPHGNKTCDWSAYTSAIADQVEVEAAGYETFDSFWTAGWYRPVQFHREHDRLSSDAIVTGLLGLDCVHGCKTELHPAYLVAARVPGALKYHDGIWDDSWAIFVRNFGNEGWCSHNDHPLGLSRVLVDLPPPPGVSAFREIVADTNDPNYTNPSRKDKDDDTDFSKEFTEFKANVDGVKVSTPVYADGKLRLAFYLPPDKQARVNGLLHVRWTGNPPDPNPTDSGDCFQQDNFVHENPSYAEHGSPRSRQGGDSKKVQVLSYKQVASLPMTPPPISSAAIDEAVKRVDSNLRKMFKKHCKNTGENPCKEKE